MLTALLGLSLPVRPALAGITVITGLSVAQAMLLGVPAAPAISVPLVTAAAGVIVVAVVRQATLARELAASQQTIERLASEVGFVLFTAAFLLLVSALLVRPTRRPEPAMELAESIR